MDDLQSLQSLDLGTHRPFHLSFVNFTPFVVSIFTNKTLIPDSFHLLDSPSKKPSFHIPFLR